RRTECAFFHFLRFKIKLYCLLSKRTVFGEAYNITIPEKTVSLAMAKRVASVMEFVWKIFGLKEHPPLYKGLVNIMGIEFTTNDNKAKKELGYKPFVTIKQGFDLMRK
ncbi:Rossmann-fold NAD(P)-binding domain-containing protein, partial [Parafilimonas terrae]